VLRSSAANWHHFKVFKFFFANLFPPATAFSYHLRASPKSHRLGSSDALALKAPRKTLAYSRFGETSMDKLPLAPPSTPPCSDPRLLRLAQGDRAGFRF